MNKPKTSHVGTIIALVSILLIFIGAGLFIFYEIYWKSPPHKTPPTPPPHHKTPPTPPPHHKTPPTPPPHKTIFSISPRNSKSYLYNGWGQQSNPYTVLSSSKSKKCDNYNWEHKTIKNIPNAIVSSNTGDILTVLSEFGTDPKLSIISSNISGGLSNKSNSSWVFNDGKICLETQPAACLYNNEKNEPGTVALHLTKSLGPYSSWLNPISNPSDPNFQWNLGIEMTPPSCV